MAALAAGLACAQTTEVRLTLSGLPEGMKPPVEVTLPGGKKQTVTDAASFRAEAPGSYRATAAAFRVPGKWIDTVLEAAPAQVTVKAGQTAALTLAFKVRPGSGMLWTATARINEETDDFSKGTVRSYSEKALLGGVNGPEKSMQTGPRLFGGAAGPDGAFYYGDGWEWNAVARLAPGAARPAKMSGTEADSPYFDPDGNLWLMRDRKMKRMGSAVVIELAEEEQGLTVTNPVFLANGDLVLAQHSLVARIPKAKLAKSGTLSRSDAAATVTFTSGSITGAAVGPNGDLWLVDVNGEVVQLPAAAIEKGGRDQGRKYPIEGAPMQVALDNEGGVLVLTPGTGDLFRKAPDASGFAKIGNLGRGFDDFSRLTLNPPAVWSPLGKQPGAPVRLQ